MKEGIFKFYEGIEGAPHISIVREDELQMLMGGLSSYLEIVPQGEYDELDPEFFPEYFYDMEPMPGGNFHIVWIYFKECLSLDMVTIYFESVNTAYMIDLMHIIYAYFSEAVELIEINEVENNRTWVIKNSSRVSH